MKKKMIKKGKGMIRRMYFITLLSGILLTLALSGHAQTAPIGKTGLFWELNGNTLVITGEGNLPDYFSAYSVSKLSDVVNYRLYQRSPWYSSRENIYTVDIQTSGPTTIGNDIFAGYPNLVSVHIPANVTRIGKSAFEDCKRLTGVHLQEGLTVIGDRAFADCTSLTDVHLPTSVMAIGIWAFSGCTGLANIHLPERVIAIGSYAFSGCTGLTVIHLPEVVAIGSYAFYFCKNLCDVQVTPIGSTAFSDSTNLADVLPEWMRTIERGAFYVCEHLASVHIPKGVTRIKKAAFWGCGSLTDVHIPESVTTIERYAFHVCPNLKEVTVHWTDPSVCRVSKPAFMKSTFKKLTPGNITLHVPEGTAAKYQSRRAWKKFRITEDAKKTEEL